MRFDPPTTHEPQSSADPQAVAPVDRPADELSDGLVGELADIASRLQAESRQLALCYPPREPTGNPHGPERANEHPARHGLATALAATVALAMTLITTLMFAIAGWYPFASQVAPSPAINAAREADQTDLISRPTGSSGRRFSDAELDALARGLAELPRGQSTIAEVSASADTAEAELAPVQLSPDQKILLLEKAVDRYRSAIVYLQDQLEREVQVRSQSEVTITSLKTEVDELRAELDRLRQHQPESKTRAVPDRQSGETAAE